MISLGLDIEQPDCPFVRTSDAHDVALRGLYSDFVESKGKLKTRMLVEGTDRETVEGALDAFEEFDGVNLCHLISKWGDEAVVKTCTEPTDAMQVLRTHEGYLTAPFEVREGRKRWYVGFDTSQQAETALSKLQRHHNCSIQSAPELTREEFADVVENAAAAKTLLDACRELSQTERSALLAACEEDYYQTPRETTLVELAERFDVSDTAMSNNLRRSHATVLGSVAEAIRELDEGGG